MNEALLAVQMVNAALVAGVNLTTFLQRLSTVLQQRHSAGETLQMADLNTLFDQGDKIEAEQLARAQAAMK